MRSIWLVRHGERVDNVDSTWKDTAPRGAWDDPTLSDRGKLQSCEVGLQLAKTGQVIDYVFCSPFTRVVEATSIILETIWKASPHVYKNHSFPAIFVEPGFCKSLHSCQAVPGYLDTKELKNLFPQVDFNYQPFCSKYYKETTSICCRRRISNTIDHVLRNYPGNVLIVGHGTTVAASNFVLSGESIYVGQCTITSYELQDEDLLALEDSENGPDHEKNDPEFFRNPKTFKFTPKLIGDSSHLSDPTHLHGYPKNWKI